MTKIIAFSGAMGSGKSTAIKCLKDMGYTPHIIKFAAPLYDIQEYAYRRVQDAYKRSTGFTKDRKLLQWIGTDWGRELCSTMWVDLWRAEVERALPFLGEKELIVCDDCRFDNEADVVHSLGGKVIKLHRPNSVDHAEGGEGYKAHTSEAGVSGLLLDAVINNDSDLVNFYKQLDSVVRLFTD